jgi:hypothetical protein
VTHPVTFQGSKLLVDLDASLAMQKPGPRRRFDECEVRVALEDQSGGKVEGFTADRCQPIFESGERAVRWEGATVGSLAGKPVRLRFEMRNAALYAFQFV